jgi:hypothetical protein
LDPVTCRECNQATVELDIRPMEKVLFEASDYVVLFLLVALFRPLSAKWMETG